MTSRDSKITFRVGDDLLDRLPELIWQTPGGSQLTRWRFWDHVAERFANGFAKVLGDWCEVNNIALTGHMMAEPGLGSQTDWSGEVMRSLRHFQLPGIDMLCDFFEFTTAKQAQSVARVVLWPTPSAPPVGAAQPAPAADRAPVRASGCGRVKIWPG